MVYVYVYMALNINGKCLGLARNGNVAKACRSIGIIIQISKPSKQRR